MLERTFIASRYVYKERLTISLYFQSTFLFATPTMAETQQTICLTIQTSALLGICFDICLLDRQPSQGSWQQGHLISPQRLFSSIAFHTTFVLFFPLVYVCIPVSRQIREFSHATALFFSSNCFLTGLSHTERPMPLTSGGEASCGAS